MKHTYLWPLILWNSEDRIVPIDAPLKVQPSQHRWSLPLALACMDPTCKGPTDRTRISLVLHMVVYFSFPRLHLCPTKKFCWSEAIQMNILHILPWYVYVDPHVSSCLKLEIGFMAIISDCLAKWDLFLFIFKFGLNVLQIFNNFPFFFYFHI